MARDLTREQARNVANHDPVRIFVCGLLFGAAVGGVLGLLFAPKKGSETRRFIREKANFAAKMVQYKVEDIKEKALEAADDLEIKAAELRRRGEEDLKSLREKS